MKRLLPFVASSLLLPSLAFGQAPIFPDVPQDHMHRASIEILVKAGIVHGNPDGTFSPERTVNRAEMLKMLYLASDRLPGSAKNCFTDVPPGAWFEPYVCDAAAKNFVSGYGDGTFLPAQTVNRAEALKMLFEVMEFPAPALSEEDRNLIAFVDVPMGAWFARYVGAAYMDGILPVPGMSSTRFVPEKEVTRGEAAAYIANAIASEQLEPEEEESSSSTSNASSVSSEQEEDSEMRINVDFPFTDEGQFTEKKAISYLFTLTDTKTVALFRSSISGAIPAGITCRLYLLRDDGFSEEYYLGEKDGRSCALQVALRPGNYQLQLQPSESDVYYEISAKEHAGDDNDGFIEAKKLTKNLALTQQLGVGDHYDWFRFTVTEKTNAIIQMTATEKLSCIIYTPLTVDQFGFKGPECGVYYDYAPGTYYIGISRDEPSPKTLTYTVTYR